MHTAAAPEHRFRRFSTDASSLVILGGVPDALDLSISIYIYIYTCIYIYIYI